MSTQRSDKQGSRSSCSPKRTAAAPSVILPPSVRSAMPPAKPARRAGQGMGRKVEDRDPEGRSRVRMWEPRPNAAVVSIEVT